METSPLYHNMNNTRWIMWHHHTRLLSLLAVGVPVCLVLCPAGHVVGGRAECWRDLKHEKFYESAQGLFL